MKSAITGKPTTVEHVKEILLRHVSESAMAEDTPHKTLQPNDRAILLGVAKAILHTCLASGLLTIEESERLHEQYGIKP